MASKLATYLGFSECAKQRNGVLRFAHRLTKISYTKE